MLPFSLSTETFQVNRKPTLVEGAFHPLEKPTHTSRVTLSRRYMLQSGCRPRRLSLRQSSRIVLPDDFPKLASEGTAKVGFFCMLTAKLIKIQARYRNSIWPLVDCENTTLWSYRRGSFPLGGPRRHRCRRAFRHDVATSFIPSRVDKALKRLLIRVYGR